MRSLRKIVAGVLAVVIIFSVLLIMPTTASAFSVPDENGFATKLAELQNKYRGTYSGTYYEGGVAKAWQCHGYAWQIAMEVFGSTNYSPEDNGWGVFDTLGEVYAGDVIQFYISGGTHSIFVTKVEGDNIYFTDANWDLNNGIRWDAHFSYSYISSRFCKKYNIWGNRLKGTGSSFVDLGTDFYASITHIGSWNHLTAESDGNVDICWDNNTANQYWKFFRQYDGSYKIKSASTGKCLEVQGGSWQDGANIQVYDENETDAQKWYIYKCGDGYQLKAKCTDCVMEMNAWNWYQGVNLVSGSRDGSDAEFFAINIRNFNEIGNTNLNCRNENGTAVFEWNNAKCSTNYNIKIWIGNSVLPGEAPINLWNVKGNIFKKLLGEGTFTAYIESFNPLGDYVQSTPITFTLSVYEQRAEKIINYNNHIYSIYNIPVSWSTAKEMCELIGGHLVTINSQEEQDVVNQLLDYGSLTYYSVGSNNINSDWHWITGEPMNYSNWAKGEPNNVGNIEHYMTVLNTNSLKGQWNDIGNTSSDGIAWGFICEVENTFTPVSTTYYKGHKYLMFDNTVSWEIANEISSQKGGHLLTINDEEEQYFIQDYLSTGSKRKYWLGSSLINGEYHWNGGKPLTYNNYYEGQPSNSNGVEAYLQIYGVASEKKYKWNDNKNLPYDTISDGFIIEFDNQIGDTNLDGTVDVTDATRIQMYAAGLVDSF